jgi:gluconate kinase
MLITVRDVPKRKADHYLQQAEECREQAARALRDEDRESWLKLAAKWQRMAEGTRQPAQQAQQPQGEREG